MDLFDPMIKHMFFIRLFYVSLSSARLADLYVKISLSSFVAFWMKLDGLSLDVVLGVSVCDSENPQQKPRILSVELEEMLICMWTRKPTQMMTRSCPIIHTPTLFLPLTRSQSLDYCFILCPHFFLFISLSAILSCALHLANNTSVENSEECILFLR